MDLNKILDEADLNTPPVKKVETRGRKKGDNGLMLDPGDNVKYMKVNMILYNMKRVDIKDVTAVQARLNDFFQLYAENDMKPTVAGMGMALDMDRRRVWEIKTGRAKAGGMYDVPPEVVDVVKKAYLLMENLWETYMSSGKINPISGIFLGKNNFGYQDKTEYVLTPTAQSDNDYDADAIKERYVTVSKPERLCDSSEEDS